MAHPDGKGHNIRGVVPYEDQLARDLEWALVEGSLHFENRSRVHQALIRITQCLTERGIPYAVVGGMALFAHGFRRFTEDVNFLVGLAELKRIHREISRRRL